MAFTGYDIFPGLTVLGAVSPAVQELALNFNMEALQALQQPARAKIGWIDGISGVTPAVFKGKIPIDFTALDGFEPYDGVRHYKQVDVAAIEADVNQWQRNLEWDYRLNHGNVEIQSIYNVANYAKAMIDHARVMKARLGATVLMQGTPGTAKALVYAGNAIPGAGLPLFSNDATTGQHYANPMAANSRRFNNYFTAVGKFDADTFKLTRQNMQAVPNPTLSAETLGIEVTDIFGPTHMAEDFKAVAQQGLSLQAVSIGGTPVAAATTNIYAAGETAWRYWICPQLDADPFLIANPGAHLWFAVSTELVGAHPIEMVAPTKEFTPMLQFFGEGTEMAATSRKLHLLGDLDAGAAPGLPHVVARYEEV